MAANFQIITRRKSDQLHLRLRGDFDGMSAMVLICTILDNFTSAKKICIETEGILSLLPFGQEVFRKNLPLSPSCAQKLTFMGTHSLQMAPKGAIVTGSKKAG